MTQSYKEAAVWYRKAANQGRTGAQFNLGLMYDIDQGCGLKIQGGCGKVSKSADQGLAQAQFLLGLAYEEGHGVPDAVCDKWRDRPSWLACGYGTRLTKGSAVVVVGRSARGRGQEKPGPRE